MNDTELNNIKVSIVRFRGSLEANPEFYNMEELKNIKEKLGVIKREITRLENVMEGVMKGGPNPLF